MVGFNYQKLLNLLVPRAEIQQLPVLPLLAEGRQEQLLMSTPMNEKRLVLRLWPTVFKLSDIDQALWVGSVDFEYADSMVNFLILPRGSGLYASALEPLREALSADVVKFWVQRPLTERQRATGWDGKTLLLAENSSTLSGD